MSRRRMISLGGMNFASGVSIHGGQLIALKEIAFAANGDGLRGTSIISGDTILNTLAGIEDGTLDEAQIRWRIQPFLSHFRVS